MAKITDNQTNLRSVTRNGHEVLMEIVPVVLQGPGLKPERDMSVYTLSPGIRSQWSRWRVMKPATRSPATARASQSRAAICVSRR